MPSKKTKTTPKRFKKFAWKRKTPTSLALFVIVFATVGAFLIIKSNALMDPPPTVGGGLSENRSKIIYIANAQKGQTEFSPKVLQYTDGNKEAWCADYVSWVYKEAGYPFTGGLSGGWRWPVASGNYGYSLINYTKYIGKYKAKASYTPEPGDIIFFDPASKDPGSHVGIVISVAISKSATVYTVEGNIGNIDLSVPGHIANGGKVDNRTYSLTDPLILGYGDMF